jgi:hypothetical protein
MRSAIMLGDDEDIFDSVTWEESPTPEFDGPTTSHGPGFIQSTADVNEDPLQPKWEGYLMTSVRDPVKELAETKDAYVSYLVSAKVRLLSRSIFPLSYLSHCRPTFPYFLHQTRRLVVAFKTSSF